MAADWGSDILALAVIYIQYLMSVSGLGILN
jgi:hypothetical protein